MNKIGWYSTVQQINKELEERKIGKDFHLLDEPLQRQIKILLQIIKLQTMLFIPLKPFYRNK